MKGSEGRPVADGAGHEPTDTEQAWAERRLTPEELLERRRGGERVYVFDLRDPDAFEADSLPGAFNLPLEYVEANLTRLPFIGEMLFYDGGDGAAAQAAAILHDNGFGDFYFCVEGWPALKAALAADPAEVRYGELNAEQRQAAIESVLDEKVRAFLASDGGGLEVLSVEDDRVVVSYQGACGGCASATTGTLRFIENALTVALNHRITVDPV